MAGPLTRWTVIRDAAEGGAKARSVFARTYQPVVRAYLAGRWRIPRDSPEVDDAVQDVFVECLREDGPLRRADPDRPGGFRVFLYGVVRNVARRFEERRLRSRERPAGSRIDLDGLEGREASLSRIFDRAWASLLLAEAARRQAQIAEEKGPDARRRVELLCLRFEDDLTIREIARQWEVDPSWLHHQYAQARREFRMALRELVRDYLGGGEADVETECVRLLALYD
jgi:RNA polymerase sigma-70 factor (ECF subfamily)